MRRSTKLGIAVAGVTAAAAAAAIKMTASTNDVPSVDSDRAEPALEPNVDGEVFLERLGRAIRLETVALEDRSENDPAKTIAFHDFLRDTYPLTHERCTVETINDLSLLFTWEGTDPDAAAIVLMAHIDVVPIEPGTETDWTVPPFSGEIVDGHVWGRGAIDDKGPLIATIGAVEHLISSGFEPSRTIYLAFGHDEEIGGAEGGSHVATALRERGVQPWFVIDEGGAVIDSLPMLSEDQVALVKVAEKGYVNVELTATSEGGHSSVPPASTAVGQIATAVSRLESNPIPARVGVLAPLFEALAPKMDPKIAALLTNLRVTAPVVARMMSARPTTNALIRTSTAVTMVSGGVKPNVLPQVAWAVVNFRILPGDTVDSVLAHVRAMVGPEIGIETYGELINEPSGFSSTDSDAWVVLRRSVEETFPDATVAPWILTGATDSRYLMPFAGDVYGFAPFTMAEDDAGIHGTNEAVRVGDATGAVSFYCRLIRNAQP